MNAEAILRKLSQIQGAIPQLPQPRPEIEISTIGATLEGDALDDFECAAVADALEAMADDLAAAIADARADLFAKCLEVYYAAEELSRDPAHADLIPHVEEMRRAYQQSCGKPIPARRR